jgi:hypothetical protein
VRARKSDLLARVILAVALVLFLLSIFLVNMRWEDPFTGGMGWQEDRGYDLWKMMYEALLFEDLDHVTRFLISASVVGSAMILVAPFLVGVLSRSRPLWWLGIICSGISLAAYAPVMIWSQWQGDWDLLKYEFCLGYYFDSASMVLNFVGLLCVRRRVDQPIVL